MRRNADKGLGIGQHAPPGWRWRLGTKTDIAEAGLGENAQRKLDGALNDQQIRDVGKDMFNRDPRRVLACDTGGQNELPLPKRKGRAARDPGENGYVENANGDDRVDCTRAENGSDQDRDDKAGKSENQI